MKGFLFALVGDLLSINAIAAAFLPGIILKEIDTPEKMNIQTVISNSSLMFFLALTGIELTLAGLVLCINGLANKKGNKGFNILGVVLSVFALIIPSIAFA
jgi:hypothetical protein